MNIRPILFVQLSWPSMGPLVKRRDIQLDVDVEALDQALESCPDLRVLRLFFTMFTDDFGTYGKVMHKTDSRSLTDLVRLRIGLE